MFKKIIRNLVLTAIEDIVAQRASKGITKIEGHAADTAYRLSQLEMKLFGGRAKSGEETPSTIKTLSDKLDAALADKKALDAQKDAAEAKAKHYETNAHIAALKLEEQHKRYEAGESDVLRKIEDALKEVSEKAEQVESSEIVRSLRATIEAHRKGEIPSASFSPTDIGTAAANLVSETFPPKIETK